MYKKNTADLNSVKPFRTHDGLKERRTEKKKNISSDAANDKRKNNHLNGDISFHVNLT